MTISPAADLGAFTEPVLLFGGPYGNLEATDALFAAAARHGISAGRIICTGDLVAYCADTQATVDRVREAGITVIAGNVEESLGADADDCGCGFNEGSACDILSASWFAYAARTISDETKTWMRQLPRRTYFSMCSVRFTVLHGGAANISRFLFPTTPDRAFEQEFEQLDTDAVIAGHSGIPFTRQVAGRLWHNAGVIGMPANDGTPRGWYSVLSPDGRGIRLNTYALTYGVSVTAAKIRSAGLPVAYADSLETGIWPSDDIAPPADRERRGQALSPHQIAWEHTSAEIVAG